MVNLTFLGWAIGIPVGIFVLYITVRLCATAYYKSKKEFAIWYKVHISEKRGE